MNIYFLLKLNQWARNPFIKRLGIFILHITRKRYLGIFMDPVLACNLRCKMCYFSDPEKRKTMKGIFKEEDLPKIAGALFHRALKLQIGCGAEPSLFPYNKELIRLGKQYRIPYISMTTNANLFSHDDWLELVDAGINEFTLSVHGVNKESYEYFMTGASYEKFLEAMKILTVIKETHPKLRIRLNYTINKDNLEELQTFFNSFGGYKFDVLQLRPIQPLGNTDYKDFSWEEIYNRYDPIIEKLKKQCSERGITCIAPGKADLLREARGNSPVVEMTYCYINPRYIWRPDFNPDTDTYESYAKKKQLSKAYFKNIFRAKNSVEDESKRLNYELN
ncbi:MAG: radical SAM protein [Candidatus Azobacteroides sp.]|nr:radical SAM protein [Candidatus Azobacteroides sp.]